MKSFLIKILICFSQIIYGVPAFIFTYIFTNYLERKDFFIHREKIWILIVTIGLFAILSIIFYPVWKFFLRKTGLLNSKEYKALQDAMRK